MTLLEASILEIFPTATQRRIIYWTTLPFLALDTSPDTVVLAKQQLNPRKNHYFYNEARASLDTKRAIALVCKPWRLLVEEYLFECVFLEGFDLIDDLRDLLSSPSLVPGKARGELCKRLDFALGRGGHWWSGEGRKGEFKNLWGILPQCKNLEMLIIDPYITEYSLPPDAYIAPFALPGSFWDTLIRTCAATLKLLVIRNMGVYVHDFESKLVDFPNLEVLENVDGWPPHRRNRQSEVSDVLSKLHYFRAWSVEALWHLQFPALTNAFIATLEHGTLFRIVDERMITGESLKRLTYVGPSVQLLEVCEALPNLEHLCLQKTLDYHWHVAWTNATGYVARSLITITIYHQRGWPYSGPLLDDIVNLKSMGALPNLNMVHYIENSEDTRHFTYFEDEGDPILLDRYKARGGVAAIQSSFQKVQVELRVERRFLGSERVYS
jgi:hypothetical protein